MSGFFYQMGRAVAPRLAKARWILHALGGRPEESIRAEQELGAAMALAYLGEHPADPDPHASELLTGLSDQLRERLVKDAWQFQVRCVHLAEANAFALPGGYIFIGRPLLELCRFSRHETAFIIGHEMAHVVKRHALHRLFAAHTAQVFSRLITRRSALARHLGPFVTNLLQQGYSRDHEFQADRFAFQLCRAAGLEGEAGISMLARLKQSPEEAPLLQNYFASHPPLDARIQALRRLAAG